MAPSISHPEADRLVRERGVALPVVDDRGADEIIGHGDRGVAR